MLISSADFDITKVKLIIWDLDNTFWQGTISEGDIHISAKNVELVKELSKRGIVNSICSKNDFKPCEDALRNMDVWEYFVFPSIDWTPKSNRIHSIIADMNLRPANVLFLDDEPANLQRALMSDSSLMCATADDICDAIWNQLSKLQLDESCKRLKQYRELQNKQEAKKNFASDDAFLRVAGIQVSIHEDCWLERDRIHELINRTNQLNYTKRRRNKEEVERLLRDDSFRCGYVCCKDKFCDYGIVGFFAVNRKEHKLEHFLFSCRTIGMGVEQFAYAFLEYPAIEISGAVVTRLQPAGCPDWIELVDCARVKSEDQTNGTHKILIKGPCDVSQIFPFFAKTDLFREEFAYVSQQKEGMYIESFNHTSQIILADRISNEKKDKLVTIVPFIDEEYFRTDIFSNMYDFVIFSALTDYGLGLYRSKTDPELIVAFGQYTSDYTQKENWQRIVDAYVQDRPSRTQVEREFARFAEEFEAIGRISDEAFLCNLEYIRKRMAKHTKLIFLNGAERPYEGVCKASHMDRHVLHSHMNMLLKRFVDAHKENCTIIDVNNYLSSEDPYLDTINHYKKTVYYHLAGAIQQYIEQCDTTLSIKRKSPAVLKIEEQYVRLRRKVFSILRRVRQLFKSMR